MPGFKQITFLNNVVDHPQIEIGDYTYYDNPDGHEHFLKDVLYLFDFVGDKLILGKFCAIARGVRLLMNGGNHATDGLSTYPFFIFANGWEDARRPSFPYKGDTVIGHDVWLGYDATLLPGVQVGSGAIIGAGSVVTKDVRPYAIVAGNPAREVRRRFDDATIDHLLTLAWWDWPADKITRNLKAITAGNFDEIDAT
jgi:virginiamycin A acetyltransferase